MTNYQQSGPENFEELMRPLPKDVREIATRLRAIVKATIPDADEAVSGGTKIGMALYSINGANNVICGIQPTENMCKLFFHGWEQLKKSGYRLEGSGKHARHIKIHSTQELESEKVADMIEIAHGAL
ncbi:MAG TPA: DUF1801 domain-containing protein [Pirellulaceae bacterium]|nr:DUF1801 domain-containing protein [Pirellulaceae bacterium]HMO94309.1 DUF1801 domain-containing protein [Pirellulaceae bacterium]HMP71582.1 DUF1801 domain-containing protein [Pirellulaceae bacterium]